MTTKNTATKGHIKWARNYFWREGRRGWKYSILAEIFVTSKIRFVTLAKIYSTSEEIFDTSKETLVTLGEICVTPAKIFAI